MTDNKTTAELLDDLETEIHILLGRKNDMVLTLKDLQEDIEAASSALEGQESETAQLLLILLEQMNNKIVRVLA